MNHFELKSEIAKGHGEYLSAFAETMGCPAKAQDRLNQQLRLNFSKIYYESKVHPEKVLEEVYHTIFSDRDLTNQCSLGIG